jgi:hypothetical protein
LQGINVTCDEVGGIVKYQNIDEGLQLLQGGQSGEDVVGYVQRPWGIHIDMVRNRGSKGMDGCPLTLPPHIQQPPPPPPHPTPYSFTPDHLQQQQPPCSLTHNDIDDPTSDHPHPTITSG